MFEQICACKYVIVFSEQIKDYVRLFIEQPLFYSFRMRKDHRVMHIGEIGKSRRETPIYIVIVQIMLLPKSRPKTNTTAHRYWSLQLIRIVEGGYSNLIMFT